MLFKKAIDIMGKGGHVESLVSHTEYSVNLEENKLYSEGIPVEPEHLTQEEINGEWREVYIVETKEDMDKLTEIERDALIEETLKGATQKRIFDEKYRIK